MRDIGMLDKLRDKFDGNTRHLKLTYHNIGINRACGTAVIFFVLHASAKASTNMTKASAKHEASAERESRATRLGRSFYKHAW